jgi:hypothetical protein
MSGEHQQEVPAVPVGQEVPAVPVGQEVPRYLSDNIYDLKKQWEKIISPLDDTVLPFILVEKKCEDAITRENIYPNELVVYFGWEQFFKPNSFIGWIKRYIKLRSIHISSLRVRSVFMKAFAGPIAGYENNLEKNTICLFVDDGEKMRCLNQAELNWFITGKYNQHNTTPVTGFRDPMRRPLSISQLNAIFNLYFRPINVSELRSKYKLLLQTAGKKIKSQTHRRNYAKRTRKSTTRRRTHICCRSRRRR